MAFSHGRLRALAVWCAGVASVSGFWPGHSAGGAALRAGSIALHARATGPTDGRRAEKLAAAADIDDALLKQCPHRPLRSRAANHGLSTATFALG
jgi:hypothetical protein